MIEVLGWDAHSSRVYFHAVYWDESVHFDAIYHFDLRSKHPEFAVRDQPEPADSDWVAADSAQAPRIAALRARLQRLAPILEPGLPTWVQWTEQDTIVETYGKARQFQVTGSFDDGPGFDAICYGKPDICARGVYGIPGRKERVWLIAFRGQPSDAAQVEGARLVRVGEPNTTVRLRWNYLQLP